MLIIIVLPFTDSATAGTGSGTGDRAWFRFRWENSVPVGS